MSETYLRIDDDGKYRACELIDGRRTRDLPTEPFKSAREACEFVAIHDGRGTLSPRGDVTPTDLAISNGPPLTATTPIAAVESGPRDPQAASLTGLRDRRARGDRPDHPTPDHEHVFVRHAPFSDLVMPDGKAARTWMKCLGCPERREIVRSVK